MKLLPFHRLRIHTQLTPSDVVERLAADTEPPDLWRSVVSTQFALPARHAGQHKYFEGHVNERTFALRHVNTEVNHLRPVAIGKIIAIPDGTLVCVHLRPGVYALFVITVFFSVCATFAVLPLFDKTAPAFSLFGFGGMVLLALITHLGFSEDASSVATYLDIVLDGAPSASRESA